MVLVQIREEEVEEGNGQITEEITEEAVKDSREVLEGMEAGQFYHSRQTKKKQQYFVKYGKISAVF